jgi:hypothetical protein
VLDWGSKVRYDKSSSGRTDGNRFEVANCVAIAGFVLIEVRWVDAGLEIHYKGGI